MASAKGFSRCGDVWRDGDWTCPKCGNVNFSFRTVCNRGSCGTARPSASPSPWSKIIYVILAVSTQLQRPGAAPYPGGFDRQLPSYYGGVVGPPPMPHGMSGGFGSPLPPLHGLRYDYGPPTGAAGLYGLMSPYGPSGSIGGPIGVYGYGLGPVMDRYGGPDPMMNRYGYGYRGFPMPLSGPTSAEQLDNSASRKRRGGPDGLSEGDWVCPKCENVNFAFRTTCNMKKCGAPRPALAPNRGSGKEQSDAPEGSWTCEKCNNVNYPFRTVCNRKGCGNEKPSSSN
ncbi:hypothetical protein ZIOFF_039833 [Zingiber officinale]|uniref:RanBP2-type domain-containing protein n=1 Tax=Zingiber officinale TaxID=94328 RepID=A0A8J5KXH7_ZINOF|nr:hypothetical protein ZIOFF_039833 [Zingiber officinale]